MPNTQVMMGVIATLLVVVIVLLTNTYTERHRTIGDSLHEAVQEIKR
jgi:beta-lactam-binding protein with PASTA domain